MKYQSIAPMKCPYEIEIDLICDLKAQMKQWLTKWGISSTSENALYEYFNFLKRYIIPKPRKVKKSKEFVCPIGYEGALREIEEKIVRGENLLPYFSTTIKNAGYNDGLLNDWNIHHLHLSTEISKGGFVRRSDYQIFVYITEDTCYMLQIYAHQKPHLYSTQEMVKIIDNNWPQLIARYRIEGFLSEHVSDAEYDAIRKAHMLTMVQTAPNKMFGMIGGGYASNGASTSAVSASDYWHNLCRGIEHDMGVLFPEKILASLSNLKGNYTSSLCIKLLFFYDEKEVTLYESNNGVIIEINYKDGYIRICNPQDLFGYRFINSRAEAKLCARRLMHMS